MRTKFFRAVFVAAVALSLAVAASLAALWYTLPQWAPTRGGTTVLLALGSAATGYRLQAARVEVPETGRFELIGLEVAAGKAAFFQCRRMTLLVTRASLARRALEGIAIEGFRVDMARMPAGRAGDGRVHLPFEQLRAQGGRVEGGPAWLPPLVISDLNVTAAGGGEGAARGASVVRVAGIEVAAKATLGEDGRALELVAAAEHVPSPAMTAALGPAAERWKPLVERVREVSLNLRLSGTLPNSFHASLQIEAAPSSTQEGVGFAATVELPSLDPPMSGTVALRDFRVKKKGGELSAKRAEAHLSLTADDDGRRVIGLDDVSVSGLAGHDQAYVRAVEGLAGRGRLTLRFPREQTAEIETTLSLERGEVLWDRFYASLDDHPVRVAADVRLSAGAEGRPSAHSDGADTGGLVADIETATIEAAGLGTVSLRGKAESSGRSADVDTTVSLPDVAPAYRLFLVEPFADVYPLLSRVVVAGNVRLTAHLVKNPTGNVSVSATARVRSGRVVSADERWMLTGIAAELPVELDTAGVRHASRTGYLRADRAVAGGLGLGTLDIPLAAKTNTLSVPRSLDVDVLGGRVSVTSVRARDLADRDRSMSFAVALSDLRLRDVCESLGLPALDGVLEGRLSRILVHDSLVETEGGLQATLLGGRAEIDRIAVRGLTSSVPVVALDVRLSGIDLEQATAALGVGRVSGIADAYITGLELAGGEPVRFDARLQSVPRRGVRQRISVRAIEQLSILGGAGSSPIARGILSFFDEYRYARLGLRCSLRNDRFVLEGLERRKNKDFLVVGTLMPPSVNVISHNQVISFKDMVARLGRIAASGEGGGQGR